MKLFNKLVIVSLIGSSSLLSLLACKDNSLVFPEQIVIEDEGSTAKRGPVKQNNLPVIIDDDETVKFELVDVDTERIASLIFSHNSTGELVTTEVSDFSRLYSIANLPLDQATEVEVWAKGLDDLESKKFTYKVTPKPFPAKAVLATVTLRASGFDGVLTVTNTSKANAQLFYKLDDVSEFSVLDVPVASLNLELVFSRLGIGTHELTFYVKDEHAAVSETRTLMVAIDEPSSELFTAGGQKAGWTPWAPNGYDAGFSAERALDGTLGDGYEFVSGSNANPNRYKISFTKTRITADPNYRDGVAENPTGEHELIVVKSATLYSGAVSWGVNPSMAHVYGYLEDDTVVDLGTFASPTEVSHNNPFVIDLSTNVQPLKAIRFDVVNSLSNPTATGMNLNEIHLAGYKF